jgi:hypothetical protein
MIRSVYLAVRECGWNRDRRRRMAAMLADERPELNVSVDQLDAMAVQLAEIRALPEAAEPLS